MLLTAWLVATALASTGTLPTVANTAFEDLLDQSELVFTATVSQCRKARWSGPAGGTILRRCLLQVHDQILGQIESGWVHMPLHRDDPRLEDGAEIAVVAHTAKLSCTVAACVDSRHYASLPAFSDAVVMMVKGAVLVRDDTAVSALHHAQPDWLAGLDWDGALEALRGGVVDRPASDAAGIVLPGAPSPM